LYAIAEEKDIADSGTKRSVEKDNFLLL